MVKHMVEHMVKSMVKVTNGGSIIIGVNMYLVLVITWQVCCWFIPPDTRGRVAPEGEGGINRNIPTRHVIIDLLPIMTSNSQ